MIQNTLFTLAFVLFSAWCPSAQAAADTAVPVEPPPRLTAAAHLPNLGDITPPETARSTAAPVTAAALLERDDTTPVTGWRERFALLGAAVLALLFILRRQWAHRIGESSSAAAQRSRARDAAWHHTGHRHVAMNGARAPHGFLLSQLDNLPPPVEPSSPHTSAAATAALAEAPSCPSSPAPDQAEVELVGCTAAGAIQRH